MAVLHIGDPASDHLYQQCSWVSVTITSGFGIDTESNTDGGPTQPAGIGAPHQTQFNFISGVIRLTDYPATHLKPAFALAGQTDGGRRDGAKVSPSVRQRGKTDEKGKRG